MRPYSDFTQSARHVSEFFEFIKTQKLVPIVRAPPPGAWANMRSGSSSSASSSNSSEWKSTKRKQRADKKGKGGSNKKSADKGEARDGKQRKLNFKSISRKLGKQNALV
jgi:hypothetical protein